MEFYDQVKLLSGLITDNDNNDKINYINIKSKNLDINIHKKQKERTEKN